MSDTHRTIGKFNVVSGSPAAQAAIRVLEKQGYLRQAQQAEADAALIVNQAKDAMRKAIREVKAAEGYIPDETDGYF